MSRVSPGGLKVRCQVSGGRKRNGGSLETYKDGRGKKEIWVIKETCKNEGEWKLVKMEKYGGRRETWEGEEERTEKLR